MYDEMAGARAVYIELRFDEVLEAYHKIRRTLDDLEEQAIELKERTLLWVYVIEWLVVSGTSLAAGFILWSVMVRRRLYREIGVTRLIE